MATKPVTRTLNLAAPLGKTPLVTLVILIGLYCGTELFTRLVVSQTDFFIPSVGSNHYEFEYNLVAAQQLKRDTGRLDCLFVGSSMSNLAIDPQVVVTAFKTTTNQDIVCYNFSLNGAKAYTVGKLSKVLGEDLQPKLIIYGLSARDFVKRTQPDPVVDIPWIKYRWGEWSFPGWLTESSYTYRLYLRYSLREQTAKQPPGTLYTGVGRYGYNQYFEQAPTDPASQPVKVAYPDYEVDPINFNGLKELLELRNTGVQVILVEMPVQPVYLQTFSDADRSYQKFVDSVTDLSHNMQVPFWRMADQPAIPAVGWRDRFHLNNIGAITFSAWLGQRLGQSANNGEVSNLYR